MGPVRADTAVVRRPVLAVLAALLGALSLVAPASAGETTDIVIGRADGSFEVRPVPAATVASAIAAARRRPDVAWVEIDQPVRAAETVVPNDARFAEQWGLPRVRVPEAWAQGAGDTSVVVAVIDTGVDASHPDLVGNVLEGADFVNDGHTGDPSGHGTAVAGVIAARGNNHLGIVGHCWTCRILPVRALDRHGDGTSSGIAAGILWAADHGADIINLSLTSPTSSVALEFAVAAARAKGILVVAAAGNQSAGQELTVPQYPAATDGVIGVVGTTQNDAPYIWTHRGQWADVAAPGCALSTATGGGYAPYCGTSFAAPAVAGVLALALSAFPSAPAASVETALFGSSVPLPGGIVAHGRVDATGLLEKLGAGYPFVRRPERVAGNDRIATAVALSQRAFAAADTVVVARSDSYADALAASALAGTFHAPVLLSGSSGLPGNVASEIARLGATTAWVIGGTGALSPAVEAGLRSVGVTPTRIAGTSRYDTAGKIAQELGSTSVFVAPSGGWADAVAVSGLAALTGIPILLVDQDRVPAETALALSSLQPTTITVLGGVSVVSDAVVTALGETGATVSRLSGANRYETSKAIATVAASSGADPTRTWVATGTGWPDALAAGPAAAAEGAVMLLVDGASVVAPSSASWFGASPGVHQLVVVGGPASITEQTAAILGMATHP